MKDLYSLKKGHGRALFLALSGLLVFAVAIAWGWNTFAVELLEQQPMKIKHALGLEVLVLAAGGLLPLARRLPRAGHFPDER